MLYILILLSLTGIGISVSKWYKREHSKESEMETEDETENHPVAQINSVLFRKAFGLAVDIGRRCGTKINSAQGGSEELAYAEASAGRDVHTEVAMIMVLI